MSRRLVSLSSVLAALAVATTALGQAAPPPPGVTTPGTVTTPTPATPTPAPPVEPPVTPVISDTSAPSVPGSQTPAISRGNEPARTITESPSAHQGRFQFGSYGRVVVGSDLRGGTGRGSNVVAFGPRIVDEGNYAELELRREDEWSDRIKGRIVATLALFPPFFHFSGKPQQAIGVRNLYAQATYDKLTLWAGSRMYRGDDIYLLNWWPLDNQNTVGGGVGGPIFERKGGGTDYETVAQIHAGQQRLDNIYQFQTVPVVSPFGFGSVDITKLDRPRTIETFKLTQFIRPSGKTSGFKAVLYGELHQIAAGTYVDPLTNNERGLPQDSGFLIGSQLTYFTGQHDTYASLFMRHARGLAAYDPLAVPNTFALDRTTSGASETQIALAGNFERERFAILWAGYLRFFRDPSPTPSTLLKYDEGVIVARPSVFLGEHFGVSVEGSYQQRHHALLDQGGTSALNASVTKLGVIPYFSPSGKGSFKRPQIRLLYVASFRNSGARALYPAQDIFAQRGVEHFAGIAAEWWFNSSSYP